MVYDIFEIIKAINLKLPVLILSILFLLTSVSITFCEEANQKDSISFLGEDLSSSNTEANNNGKSDNSLKEVELIAYIPNNIAPFSLAVKQTFDVYCNRYVSPIKVYDNPPPEC